MCGITGFWTARDDVLRDAVAVTRAMCDTLTHRGPDAEGQWTDPDLGVAFGHRRLSIIDLSLQGRQPMTSADGRWVISYNGEVYNFEALREAIDDVAWRGDSDTEVVLETIAHRGVLRAAQAFVGMFAFTVFDRRRRELHLVRDRLGIKPLFWGQVAGALLFGSELSALRAFPGFDAEIDRDALASYMRHNCVPAPMSIYQGVHKLMPGTIATFVDRDADPSMVTYWSAEEVVRDGRRDPLDVGDDEACDALEGLLGQAVRDRMVADVGLGAFLSGGIDSSTVVALMQAGAAQPVRTFSIGFDEEGYDEAVHAAAVADHLGTQHTELYVAPDDARAVIPDLPTIYDEPFSDSSQIPTHLVSKLAREHVTVSLSGDGGDELFAGYNRHLWGPRVWRAMELVPRRLRRRMSRWMLGVGADRWDRLFGLLDPVTPGALRVRLPVEKLQKLAEVMPADSPEALYRTLTSHWKPPTDVVLGARDVARRAYTDAPTDTMTETMMLLDLLTYLPDDILTKVDRASMAVSLEARVPLLDHRVVEFAWRVPLSMKVRDSTTKWLLRQVLYRHVPRELVDRPKMGFGIPIDAWLRGSLRDWAEELLDADRLRREGYFRPEPIRRKWEEHLAGRRNWQHHLWDVLMFQAWLEAT